MFASGMYTIPFTELQGHLYNQHPSPMYVVPANGRSHPSMQGVGTIQPTIQPTDGGNSSDAKAQLQSTNLESTRGSVEIKDRAARALKKVEDINKLGNVSKFYKQSWFHCLLAFMIWLFSGVVFYTQWQEWTFWTAIYYTVQAGFSIGFGFPNEEDICGREEYAYGNAAKYYQDPYDGPENNGRGGCMAADISKLATTMLIIAGSSIIAACLGVLAQSILGDSTSWYKVLLKEQEHKLLLEQAQQTEGWTDDVVIAFKRVIRKPIVKAVFAFASWVAFGIIYGMLSNQRMTFLTALYFAVSSISTAGLEALKPLGNDNDEIGAEIEWNELEDWHFAFVFFFTVIGVPLYGWALTEIASTFVDKLDAVQLKRSVYQQLSPDEFDLTLCLGTSFKEEITMHKWVELHLLRLNKVTVSDLFFIKQAFLELDVDGSGSISRAELEQTGASKNKENARNPHIELALKELREQREKLGVIAD